MEPYVDVLNDKLPAYDIDSRKRVASFLAQVGHESGGFTARVENLNYSAAGLRKVFPRYFPSDALANAYARKPERIANRVYANRMSNGDEASGDGWRYRGKSLIQVTGKANHEAFAKWIGMTLTHAIAYLLTLEGAVMGAVWFWVTNDLNSYADADRITDLSEAVNGGTNGLAERKAIWREALALI
ncbi:putative chitinase [Sphingomonas rubra]|uniref:Putative chitinase n=1 Tax=Sphingomonas rubra TaxID=634430 RepID=A0A1I5UZK0_9SPHN|nr:putative chitinase [Sphingomonas rubra]